MIGPRAALTLAAAVIAGLVSPASASATITVFPLPATGGGPTGIVTGPDGALWFGESPGLGTVPAKVGRITTSGQLAEFPLPTTSATPFRIASGPDGALWLTEGFAGRIARITTAGSVTEFAVPGASTLVAITPGPDGALWFTDVNGVRIGRITTNGSVSQFALPPESGTLHGITAGPDGALWFTEPFVEPTGRIGRITTTGAISERTVPIPGAQPYDIVTGPDGALWFTDLGTNSIWRMTTGGTFARFPIRTPAAQAETIAVGPDGALWFTETTANKIGRMTTGGDVRDFRVPAALDFPRAITAGPDGALWFTGGNAIGRITTDQPAEDAVDGTLFTQAPCNPPQLGCTRPRFVFRASSDAAGGHPVGTVEFVTGERAGVFVTQGDVTCLAVHGRAATVGVHFEAPLPAATPQAQNVLLFVEDNGEAGTDRFAVQPLPGAPAPVSCPASPPLGVTLQPGFGPAGVASSPGVVVQDANAVPISKDDCRHGGYDRFGFKNQGQCIAFVRHRARQACVFERVAHGRAAFRAKYGTGVPKRHAMRRCIALRIGV